jgi:hypothetical protein
MVPIYLAPQVVPHAVLEEERAIIQSEGWYHVCGKYIASAPDADNARRVEAERRVAERQRLAVCAFCYESIPDGVIAVTIAMRSVHPHCAVAFDRWVSETPAENDARWLEIADETPVEFDGEICAWGDLMLADRKEVEMLTDGRLIGRYPF